MKKIVLIFILSCGLYAKTITHNDVYAQSVLIRDHVYFLLKNYGIKHHHDEIVKRTTITTKLKPRNAWQKAYEILIKINILRLANDLPRIVPIGIEPVEQLNPDMVYGMTQRILAEIKIFEVRKGIKVPEFKVKKFNNKTSLDVYNQFSNISATFDELNRSELSPDYVFAETMRIYDDLTVMLKYLGIKDETIPSPRLEKATPNDSLEISMKVLELIKKLQRKVGIKTIDFSRFDKREATPSDVYTITGVIIAELQPIKAYMGLTHNITPPALIYVNKISADIEQLMGWNLRKLKCIENLDRR